MAVLIGTTIFENILRGIVCIGWGLDKLRDGHKTVPTFFLQKKMELKQPLPLHISAILYAKYLKFNLAA